MPTVKMIGHEYAFPIADILRLFYGECTRAGSSALSAGYDSEMIIYSKLSGDFVSTWIEGKGDRFRYMENKEKFPVKREVKRQLYLLLSSLLDRTYPWGSLTGIRPTVVAREVKSAKELSEKYFVREDKALLAMETALYEDRILSLLLLTCFADILECRFAGAVVPTVPLSHRTLPHSSICLSHMQRL